jgi:light-regulated signal transduction histidine kinase (bacteriophytochrome)
MAEELGRTNDELAQANRELEAFSYSVSHDLRAPLRAIDGFSRMLEEDYGPGLDAEARRLIGVVRTNAARMGRLIDDLLQFARVGRQQAHPAPIDMTDLVHGVVADLSETAPAAAVTVQPLPRARGDVVLLRQVWANLISNALKYSAKRSQPTIEIGSTNGTTPGEVGYFIRDNGIGFDMQYADKLFGVFERLHRGSEFDGTGVGLAIVQRIVHRHGGRTWATGEPDKGATFYFTLPETGA